MLPLVCNCNCSPDDSCAHPFKTGTALTIQGTVNGLYGALITSLPPRPKSDTICIDNDAKRAARDNTTRREVQPNPLSDSTHTPHPVTAFTQGVNEGVADGRYRGNPHQYAGQKEEDVGAYRIGRMILFRGHVRVQAPGPVSNLGLEDGYFEFPLYATNLDYKFPPDMVPVSKAEAAAERVFHPFQATMTFKRHGLQQY